VKLLEKIKSRFARDSATLQIGGMLNAAGSLVSSVALAFTLGAREQGDFYAAQALFALFFFALNLGVVQAAVSQIAGASARSLEDKVANWLAFLAKAYLAASIVLVGLGWVVLPWLADWQYDARPLGWWAWILCLTPLLEIPKVVCCAALQGTRRMLPLAQCENGMEACRAVLVASGAAITGDPLGPVLGTLAASVIGSVLAIDIYRRARREGSACLPGLRDIAGRVRNIPLREGLPLGVRIGLMRSIDALALDALPPLIILKFGGPDAQSIITYLRIAKNIMRLPLMMLQGVTRTALPAMSEYVGRGDWKGLRKIWLRTTLLAGGASCVLVCLLTLCVPWIVSTFYPAEYAAPIQMLALILALAYGIQSFHVGFDAFYIATSRLKVGIGIGLIGIVVSLGTLVWFVSTLGLTGPAWALVFGIGWGSLNLVYVLHFFRSTPVPGRASAAGG
jgi:O-antigen/teichoic acid export membrane protein